MEKLRYDLYYIKHLSIVFDLTIVVDTVKVIAVAERARSERRAARGRRRRRAGSDADHRAQPLDALSRDRRRDGASASSMLPFNIAHLGQGGVRPVDADGVGDGLLLGARPRLLGRARQVRRAVPRAAATRGRSTKS